MEIIKGKVITNAEENKPETERVIEYLTAPEPVRRVKLSFIAVLVVQVLISAAAGIFAISVSGDGGEVGTLVKEIIGRFLNG